MAFQLLIRTRMLDVTLSILALIAGGVTMEVFSAAPSSLRGRNKAGSRQPESATVAEDFQGGNPS